MAWLFWEGLTPLCESVSQWYLRLQACNLYVELSSHHPLKCLSEVAAGLGPSGSQADFTIPWSFLPCLDYYHLFHSSVAFCPCGGNDNLLRGYIPKLQLRLPKSKSDGITSCLGDFSESSLTSVTPPTLTPQPIVVFPSTQLDTGTTGMLGPTSCGQSSPVCTEPLYQAHSVGFSNKT